MTDPTMTRGQVRHDEKMLIADIFAKYPSLPRLRIWTTDRVSQPTFAVVHPRYVRDEYHIVVHDASLRDRARAILFHTNRINDLHPNAVLILCPVY